MIACEPLAIICCIRSRNGVEWYFLPSRIHAELLFWEIVEFGHGSLWFLADSKPTVGVVEETRDTSNKMKEKCCHLMQSHRQHYIPIYLIGLWTCQSQGKGTPFTISEPFMVGLANLKHPWARWWGGWREGGELSGGRYTLCSIRSRSPCHGLKLMLLILASPRAAI